MTFFGIATLIVSGEAQAQSREAEEKRKFAELLARRHSIVREVAHAREAAPSRHSIARDVAHATRATPAVSGFAGLAAATPLHPTLFGAGRDEFVVSIFESALGRPPTQEELNHYSKLLAQGLSPHALTVFLFKSPEHRIRLEEGLAPNINIHQAYRMALAEAKKAHHEGFPLP
jgi:hypothetical protein